MLGYCGRGKESSSPESVHTDPALNVRAERECGNQDSHLVRCGNASLLVQHMGG